MTNKQRKKMEERRRIHSDPSQQQSNNPPAGPNASNTDNTQPHPSEKTGLTLNLAFNFPPPKGDKDDGEKAQKTVFERLKNRLKRDFGKSKMLIEVAALLLLGIYTCETHRTNELTQQALNLTRDNFREDQRPYLAMTTGDAGNLKLVHPGSNEGELSYDFPLSNYGKSPARETKREAHILIGKDEIKKIGLHWGEESYERIIPPGDKPRVYATSDHRVKTDVFTQIQTESDPVVVYGSIEYTDIFSTPKPAYATGFCFALRNGSNELEQSCRQYNYIK